MKNSSSVSISFLIVFLAFASFGLEARSISLGRMWSKYSTPRVEFFPDGKSFVIAFDKLTRRYSFPDGKLLRTYRSYLVVKGIAISPDGKLLATAESDDGGNVNALIKVVDIQTGRVTHQFRHGGEYGYADALAFSPDGRYLASVGDEPAVFVWDLKTRKRAAKLSHHSWGNLKSVKFSSDGKYLISGGQFRDNEALQNMNGPFDSGEYAKRFNEGWKKGEIHVYRTGDWSHVRAIYPPGGVDSIVNAGGKVLVTTAMNGTYNDQQTVRALLVDIENGDVEELAEYDPLPDDFAGMEEPRFYYRDVDAGASVSKDVFFVSGLNGLVVYDSDFDELRTFQVDSATIQSPLPATISPDGKRLILLEFNRKNGQGKARIISAKP